MFNFPQNLKKFDFLIEEPFTVFEKFNFFNEDEFDKLQKEFPSENFFQSKHSIGSKKYLNNKDDNFWSFLESSNAWNNFYNYVNSEKFLNEIFNLCKKNLDFIDERKNIKSIKFKKEVKKDFLNRLIRKFKQIFGNYEVRLAFEFSLMKNGDFIPPHNDTENKLISLMIYFPEKVQQDEENLGTNFFRSKNQKMDIWKGDMMNDEESKKFYNDYEVFHHSKFQKNKIVGFLKSKHSWHDVSKIKTSTNLRKSLNINLFKI